MARWKSQWFPTAPAVICDICEGDTCRGLRRPYSFLFSCAQVDFNDFGESRLQDDAGQTVDWII